MEEEAFNDRASSSKLDEFETDDESLNNSEAGVSRCSSSKRDNSFALDDINDNGMNLDVSDNNDRFEQLK